MSLSFNKFFTVYEALRLKDVKKRQLTRKRSGAYRIDSLNQLFGKKDRLIFDIDLDESDLIAHHPLITEIQDFLNTHLKGWRINSRKEYKDGIIYNHADTEKKQGRKIGRILNSLIPKDADAERLLNAFKTDPLRNTKKDNYKVIISRHPYDIAGMSTDRNWSSCMNLGTKGVHYTSKDRGMNARYVENDIAEGSIVAYLVPGDDKNSNGKMEIRRPVSRILMKPHEHRDNYSNVAFSLGTSYGIDNLKFRDFLRNWLVTGLNKDAKGEYMIRDGLYSDSDTGVNFTIIDRSKTLGNAIFFSILSDRYDNSKYERFFTFDAIDPNESTSFDLRITVDLPKDVPIESFYYSDSYPKYINDILGSEHLGADLEAVRVISNDRSSSIALEFRHYSRGADLTNEDESGNNINLDRYEIEERWEETFRYIDIDDINYSLFRKDVISILKAYDPELSKEEERQKLIEKFNQTVDFNSASGSPSLKTLMSDVLADRPKFYQAREYFISLGQPTIDQMLEIVKTEKYKDSLKFIHQYMKNYYEMVPKLANSMGFGDLASTYPTLGKDAKLLWNNLVKDHFGVAEWIIKENPLRSNIVEFLKMLNEYRVSHTSQELDFVRDIYEDQDTAFGGKTYGLDTV
jgi:hypothetical protein